MRYRLRTLLILLAILPPILAVVWTKYAAWRAEQERQRARQAIIDGLTIQLMVTDLDLDSDGYLLDLSEFAALNPADQSSPPAATGPRE